MKLLKITTLNFVQPHLYDEKQAYGVATALRKNSKGILEAEIEYDKANKEALKGYTKVIPILN